jgi:FkbM family methyltransferase
MNTFVSSYIQKVVSNLGSYHTDNYDAHRFGPESRYTFGISFARQLLCALSKLGFIQESTARRNLIAAFNPIAPYLQNLQTLFENLSDEKSRQTLIEVVAYRTLGYRKIKLAVNNPAHWKNLRLAESLVVGGAEISTGFMHFKLSKMNLDRIGYPIEFYFSPMGILIDFIEQQYRCETANGAIECEPGDHVIDAGGCWGDTALYFAHKVGANGKVYSFEFLPDNLKIYNRNLDMNPELKRRVNLIENPIWSTAGNEIAIDANGPGTSLRPNDSSLDKMRFCTESIDHLVEAGQIEKVDFIKMDIEGAELNALKGAEGV